MLTCTYLQLTNHMQIITIFETIIEDRHGYYIQIDFVMEHEIRESVVFSLI